MSKADIERVLQEEKELVILRCDLQRQLLHDLRAIFEKALAEKERQLVEERQRAVEQLIKAEKLR